MDSLEGAGTVATPIEAHVFCLGGPAVAQRRRDTLALYAPNAIFESPLFPHLLATKIGVPRRREQLRRLFDKLAQRKRATRQYFGTGYLTDRPARRHVLATGTNRSNLSGHVFS